MKNKQIFVKLLNKGSTIRLETDVQWGIFYNVKKMFDTVWPDHSGHFKVVNDWIYYLGGGWPKDDSKGRMEQALDHFATAYIFLTIAGRGKMVEDHLRKYGISVRLDGDMIDAQIFNLTKTQKESIKKFWDKTFPGEQMPKNSVELLTILINKGQELQREICQLADKVKIGLVKQAELQCDIKKSNFMQCVTLQKLNRPKKEKRFKKAKTRVMEEKVQNLSDAINAMP